MKDLRCLNCENHHKYEFECLIHHTNYEKRHNEGTDLSVCFEESKLHKSMDRMLELLDQMNDIIDKK